MLVWCMSGSTYLATGSLDVFRRLLQMVSIACDEGDAITLLREKFPVIIRKIIFP